MLGTGDFALPTFEHLCETGHRRRRPVTQPDRPQGRKQELIPSPIKQSRPAPRDPRRSSPRTSTRPRRSTAIRELAPDLLVTAAYGQILSADLLAIPRLGGINLHGSILPAYRGAAPVARAIQNGETETGVTVIRMTPRIDAGGMIAIARTPIDPDETAGELEDRLARLGAPLVAEAIAALAAGTAQILPQDRSKVTKAPKLRKEDGLIDWSKPAPRDPQPRPRHAALAGRLDHLGLADPDSKGPIRLIVHKTQPSSRRQASRPARSSKPTHGDRLVVAAGQGAVRLCSSRSPARSRCPPPSSSAATACRAPGT